MPNHSTCARCGQIIAGTATRLWDGRDYCRKCLDEASPTLAEFAEQNSQLIDRLELNQVRAWRYLAYMGRIWFVTVGVPCGGFAFVFLCRQQWESAGIALLVFVALVLFALVYFGLQAVLLPFTKGLTVPRKVSVEDGKVHVTRGRKSVEFPLQGCRWMEGNSRIDVLEMCTALSRGIVLITPEGMLAIGHLTENLPYWRSFLRLARVPENTKSGCLWMLLFVVVGAIGGLFVGWGIGYATEPLVRHPFWITALALIGGLDGLGTALIYSSIRQNHLSVARNYTHPVRLAVMFAALSVKALGVGPIGLVLILLNALYGVALGILCQQRIRKWELEYEAESQWRK